MKKAFVHSIESFGTVDGPGTRFVIFLEGCNLRCLYCHNPDTWKVTKKQEMSVEELLEKYESVKEFVTGGITVTGGEPLLHLDFLIDFMKECKRRNIHTALDTSGGCFNPDSEIMTKKIIELVKYVDLFLMDIKQIDREKHKVLTGIYNDRVFKFVEFIDSLGAQLWIRHVVIPDWTLDDKNLYQLGKYLQNLDNVKGIEVLPYHTLGTEKYKELNKEYPLEGLREATKEEAERARKIIILGFNEKD